MDTDYSFSDENLFGNFWSKDWHPQKQHMPRSQTQLSQGHERHANKVITNSRGLAMGGVTQLSLVSTYGKDHK